MLLIKQLFTPVFVGLRHFYTNLRGIEGIKMASNVPLPNQVALSKKRVSHLPVNDLTELKPCAHETGFTLSKLNGLRV